MKKTAALLLFFLGLSFGIFGQTGQGPEPCTAVYSGERHINEGQQQPAQGSTEESEGSEADTR